MKNRYERYIKCGIAVFLTGAALLLFYAGLMNFNVIRTGLKTIGTILSPITYGLIIAYLLCPIYNRVVKGICNVLQEKFKSPNCILRCARVVGTLVVLAVIFGVVCGLAVLIIPETIRSITGLIQNFSDKFSSLVLTIESLLEGQENKEVAQLMEEMITQMSTTIPEWLNNSVVPKLGVYITETFSSAWVMIKTVLNLIIGIVVCVYVLNSKEIFKAQAKKIILALLSKEKSDAVFEFFSFTHLQFGCFIQGKIIDSLIIGILCSIFMSLLNLPYVVLISTIVGVTNVIPFFGPFVGAVPGILIILLESPIQALWFFILILVLQQFDGYILGPKILGKTNGLAGIWIVFSILLFGGLWGFAGMIIAVPSFAVIYRYTKKMIEAKLERKALPTETEVYQSMEVYGVDKRNVVKEAEKSVDKE